MERKTKKIEVLRPGARVGQQDAVPEVTPADLENVTGGVDQPVEEPGHFGCGGSASCFT